MIEFFASELFKNAMLNLFELMSVLTVFLVFIAMLILICGMIKEFYFRR